LPCRVKMALPRLERCNKLHFGGIYIYSNARTCRHTNMRYDDVVRSLDIHMEYGCSLDVHKLCMHGCHRTATTGAFCSACPGFSDVAGITACRHLTYRHLGPIYPQGVRKSSLLASAVPRKAEAHKPNRLPSSGHLHLSTILLTLK
jgi:hypothetical protein